MDGVSETAFHPPMPIENLIICRGLCFALSVCARTPHISSGVPPDGVSDRTPDSSVCLLLSVFLELVDHIVQFTPFI